MNIWRLEDVISFAPIKTKTNVCFRRDSLQETDGDLIFS